MINASQYRAIFWATIDSSVKSSRISRCGGYVELRPADIWSVEQAQAVAERAESQLGLTVVAVDPEIYDATAN